MTDPVSLCLAGAISPEVALARLLLDGWSPERIFGELDGVGAEAAGKLRALVRGRCDSLREFGVVLSAANHDGGDVESVRRMFDRAVRVAPEGSVAAYSLNDPAILGMATTELVAWLHAERLLRPDMDVLDLGCGIGRVAAAIAPSVRSVVGVDVSPEMIAEAQRRVAAPNIRFACTTGHDLAEWTDRAFDLVLAVDSVPYLLQAGVAEAHVRDFARVLRPGGYLAIFNLSYRPDPGADVADWQRWCRAFGLAASVTGAMPLKLWDGRAFVAEQQ